MSDDSEPNVKEQCGKICFPDENESNGNSKRQVESSQTCHFADNTPWTDAISGKPVCGTTEDFLTNTLIKTGYCKCNLPILEVAGNFFINGAVEAGKALEKVICPALEALDIVVAVGMAAIPPPGKAITGGMIAAVRSAKAYKYAYEAQDAAQEWTDFFLGGLEFAESAGCGATIKIPSRNDIANKAFKSFSDAPDELVPEGMNYDDLPCPSKGCRGCKGPNCRSGNQNGNENDNDEPSQTADRPSHTNENNQPEATTESAKTSDVPTTASTFSTVTTSSASATSTLDCKALAALDSGSDADSGISQRDDDDYIYRPNSETRKRRRRDPANILEAQQLEQRAPPKAGDPCGVDMRGFTYPGSGEWRTMVPWVTPKKFGFNSRDSCEDYEMNNPDDGAGVRYDTEHVLEWQTVTGFFESLKSEITTQFEHPDPAETSDKKLNFCQYFKESWVFRGDQTMNGPNPPIEGVVILGENGHPFTITQDQQKRKPLEWLASHYPYIKGDTKENMGLGELMLLEREMNSIVKNNMLAGKQIRNPESMTELIEGRSTKQRFKKLSAGEQARIAIQRLRQVVGTLRYMQNDDVKNAFAKEKTRMGAIIKFVDENLPNTPRRIKGSRTEGQARTLEPWKPQGLGQKWDAYMDMVFERAKTNAQNFMNTHIETLKTEWDSEKKREEYRENSQDNQQRKAEKKALEDAHKYVLRLIQKVESEWNKVKDWKNPWKNETPEGHTPAEPGN